jgi:hypothetical protein
MTIVEILTFAERVRKAAVVFYLSAGAYVSALATQDLSTVEGVIGAFVVLATTAGAYVPANEA